jgi:hypothetical protein
VYGCGTNESQRATAQLPISLTKSARSLSRSGRIRSRVVSMMTPNVLPAEMTSSVTVVASPASGAADAQDDRPLAHGPRHQPAPARFAGAHPLALDAIAHDVDRGKRIRSRSWGSPAICTCDKDIITGTKVFGTGRSSPGGRVRWSRIRLVPATVSTFGNTPPDRHHSCKNTPLATRSSKPPGSFFAPAAISRYIYQSIADPAPRLDAISTEGRIFSCVSAIDRYMGFACNLRTNA